jgi:hypothetical protein
MTKPNSIARKVINACNKRGITQQNAFQSFVTGGVTALAGLGTLLLLETGTKSGSLSLQLEILAIIATIITVAGIILAGASYLLLLVLRLGQPPASSRENHK